MSLFFFLLPLLLASITETKIISTKPTKPVLRILTQVEAAFGAFALTGDADFLNVTTKTFRKYKQHDNDNYNDCMTTIAKCGKKEQVKKTQCPGADLSRGAIAELIKKMKVTEIRNVKKEYKEETNNDGNVQQTEWELSNGKKTMTCAVEFKVNTFPHQYPEFSKVKLVCDRCKF